MVLIVIQIITVFLVGWISGIWINYCADVLPGNRRFIIPKCQNCDSQQINLGFVLFPKICQQCHTPRGWRVWIVEIMMVLASIYLFFWGNGWLPYLPSMLVLVYLGIVATIDIEHRLILHPISISGYLLGAIIGIWIHGPLNTLFGGLIGFGTMFALYTLGLLYVRFRHHADEDDDNARIAYGDALGFGDVNLGGVLGLLAGWPAIVLVIVIAIILAGIISLIAVASMLIRRDYQADFAIPYGPFLVSGAILVIYFGNLLRSILAT